MNRPVLFLPAAIPSRPKHLILFAIVRTKTSVLHSLALRRPVILRQHYQSRPLTCPRFSQRPFLTLLRCHRMQSEKLGQVHVLEHSKDGGVGVAKTIKSLGSGPKAIMGTKIKCKYIGMVSRACKHTEPQSPADN